MNPALENATKLKVEGKTGLLEGILNGLTDNETYICRAYVVYAEGTIYTKVRPLPLKNTQHRKQR